MSLPKVIAIVGTTAAGKTGLAIEIAKKFNGEVVSVDSRQIYKEMNIGTAKVEGEWKGNLDSKPAASLPWKEEKITKPSIESLFGKEKYLDVEGVPHWGIDLVNPDQEYSAADFKEYAEEKIDDIIKRGKLPILAGGTGMWLSAIVDNLTMTEVPADPELRAELEEKFIGDLYHEYKQLDPKGAEVDKNNKRRVVRALEVTLKTRKPFSEQMAKGEPKYEVLQIGIKVDRGELNQRINDRVDEMIGLGLIDEVRKLKDKYGCDTVSMTGIGYRQICQFLDGKQKLVQAMDEVKKATRHYAKRQVTWFKRNESVKWIENQDQALKEVEQFIK